MAAQVGLVEAKRLRPDPSLLDDMRRLAGNDDLKPDQAVALNFALARALDAEGEYEQAFGYFQRGNRLKQSEYQQARAYFQQGDQRKEAAFDPAAQKEFVDRLIATFTSDFFAERRGWGSEDEGPVLILGMPRSGTTLVEQILASHPEVKAGGELTHLRDLARALAAEFPGLSSPEAAASREQLEAMGEEYLSRIRALSAGSRLVTDKLPANFLRLGLIALWLPQAKVIHVRRNPFDTCLSIYFQHFEEGLPYSWDLAHVGAYYREYLRLMAHWRRVLPLPMLEVQYEDLVANQAEKTRDLLAYCGLSWDEPCLRFWETERAVDTASLWQVRQPIYTRSIGRWRHYEAHLGPLKQALEGGESGQGDEAIR